MSLWTKTFGQRFLTLVSLRKSSPAWYVDLTWKSPFILIVSSLPCITLFLISRLKSLRDFIMPLMNTVVGWDCILDGPGITSRRVMLHQRRCVFVWNTPLWGQCWKVVSDTLPAKGIACFCKGLVMYIFVNYLIFRCCRCLAAVFRTNLKIDTSFWRRYETVVPIWNDQEFQTAAHKW